MHLYNLFQEFVLTSPSVSIDKKTGKVRSNLSLSTLSLPCFNELYKSFYFEDKKVIPNYIADLLTR